MTMTSQLIIFSSESNTDSDFEWIGINFRKSGTGEPTGMRMSNTTRLGWKLLPSSGRFNIHFFKNLHDQFERE